MSFALLLRGAHREALRLRLASLFASRSRFAHRESSRGCFSRVSPVFLSPVPSRSRSRLARASWIGSAMIARSRVVPRRVSRSARPPCATRSPVRVRARTCADLVATRALSAVIEVDMVNIVRACLRAGSADSDWDSMRGWRSRGGHDESRTVDDDFRPCSTSKKRAARKDARVRRSIDRDRARDRDRRPRAVELRTARGDGRGDGCNRGWMRMRARMTA